MISAGLAGCVDVDEGVRIISCTYDSGDAAAVKAVDHFRKSRMKDAVLVRWHGVKELVRTDPSPFSANAKIVTIARDSAEFEDVNTKFRAQLNGQIADYNKPHAPAINFRLVEAQRIDNPTLTANFESCAKKIAERAKTSGGESDQKEWARERTGFHGTRPAAIPGIARHGLLRVEHTSGLNTSRSTDPGWFGDSKSGVYLSQHPDYTFKYSNATQDPLSVGEEVQIIMFRVVIGKSLRIPTIAKGMKPSHGYDSHSSPHGSEW